jgi:hypothetical protein
MTVDKMTVDKMTVDKMTLDKMTLDKMTVDKINLRTNEFNTKMTQNEHDNRCMGIRQNGMLPFTKK